MTRTALAVAALSVALVACFGRDTTKRLSGPYLILNVHAGDTRIAYDLGNGSSIGRVSPTVIAAGADENHVIAKVRPDRTVAATVYYIIDRRRDGPHVDPSACVVGPLDHDRFLVRRWMMRVSPALEFDVDLEP